MSGGRVGCGSVDWEGKAVFGGEGRVVYSRVWRWRLLFVCVWGAGYDEGYEAEIMGLKFI